ncbi:DUF4270 family protein [Formosa sp. 4Alg 33]|uniref:DUF4270 family protein n=1 Tax=Formosa sp. 4Alg 33 TaxID=3382189 RepID=UPI003D9C20C6
MNSIFFRTLLGACCFMMLLQACDSDTTSVIGEDWIDNGTKVFYIDTFTVNTSTYKFDSIIVTTPSRYLIGGYTDPTFGHVKTTPYIQLNSSSLYIDSDAVYDSVALLLDYTDYYYNDTIPTQKFNVYEVLETITPDEDYFYNTTTFKTNPTSIGSVQFSPTPIREDSIHFTLNSDYGKQIFEDIQDNEINSSTEFLDKYKGIMIEADDANTAVIGIGTTSKLRLYYSIANEDDTEEGYYDIAIDTDNSFNNMTSDYGTTVFNTLQEQTDELPSTLADNLNFIQAGSGLATKIDIPFIERINTLNGSGSIMDANLKISLKKNSSTDNLSTRDSLNVYIIDQKSEIVTTLTDYTGSIVYGRKLTDEFDSNYTSYVISLKYFLDLKLNATNASNLFLGITSQGFTDSVDRYILEGEDSEENNLKTFLELNYALYNEY